ncbi:hypothetical protein SEA_CECE_77 [Microbacterium phage Cece]|nr:hypothetical protein SEA_CECE_77 [Microbacterium phage Cece]
MAEFISYRTTTRINNSGMSYTLFSHTGPVGRHLHGVGRRIVRAAQAQVGKDTLQLMHSIRYDVDMARGRPTLTVSANDPIAYIHHEGTRPHAIQARNGQAMRFSSTGRIVYARTVMHPGTPPNRYLSDNLYLAKG